MMYNSIVEDCFFNAEHAGFEDNEIGEARMVRYAPAGTTVRARFAIWLADDGTVRDIRFQVTGNPSIMAATEWICRHLQGKKLSDAADYKPQFWQELLAIPRSQMASAIQIQEMWCQLLANENSRK